MNILLNITLYQVIWFLCVMGGSAGALLSLPLLVMHVALCNEPQQELRLMLILLLFGIAIDSTLQLIGVIRFAGTGPVQPLLPFWLAVIWLALATLPRHSLAWLCHKPVLAAIFGGLGGPLAYWAGVRMGAAEFNLQPVYSLVILGIIWMFFWPVAMRLSCRTAKNLDDKRERSTPAPQAMQ